MLKRVVQTNSACQRIRHTYLQFNCSWNLARKFVSFDWRVHQTQSNKNRICSDNWSSCNARISMIKARTLFEYQLEIARSNIACKRISNNCQIILQLFGYYIFCNNLQHKKNQANFEVSEVLVTLQIGKARVMIHIKAGHSNNCQIILINKLFGYHIFLQ